MECSLTFFPPNPSFQRAGVGLLRETQPSESGQRPHAGGRGRHSAGQEVKSDSNILHDWAALYSEQQDSFQKTRDDDVHDINVVRWLFILSFGRHQIIYER